MGFSSSRSSPLAPLVEMAASDPRPRFNVLTATTQDLRQLLEEGTITSLEIVKTYLDHIFRHDKDGAKCRAVLYTPQLFQLLARAAELDSERSRGSIRGPLHGIPVLLKDSIATSVELGMPTSAGSHALLTSSPSGNSDVASALLESGLIILGKTNMTELIGQKGRAGWSAVGGMCQPAYIPSGFKLGEKRRGETTPSGSSTGSAVGVACGFAPIALGTETTGSIVSPAAAAALYALKLTPGSVSLKGVLHVTACFDTVGAMGKTPKDVALTCDSFRPEGKSGLLADATAHVKPEEISVGFVDIELWRLPKDCQVQDPKYFEQTVKFHEA